MLWNESKERQERGKDISTIVNDEQLRRNRYCIRSISDGCDFFLVSNELSFRGDKDSVKLSSPHLQLDSSAVEEPSVH